MSDQASTPSMDALRTSTEEWLLSLVRMRLQGDADAIDLHTKFADMGIGSALGVELMSQLGRSLGVDLSPTLLFEHCTIALLAEYLVVEHAAPLRLAATATSDAPAAPDAPAASDGEVAPFREVVAAPAVSPPSNEEAKGSGSAVAVIGLACRFPHARNADAFWANLENGHDAIDEVPKARFDLAVWYDAKAGAPSRTYCRWGGWLDAVSEFDAEFFRIAPREAENMAPQQRLFMEIAWHALEDAGYAGARASACRTGVFVGIISSEYALPELLKQRPDRALHEVRIDPTMATGEAMSMVANRVSYVFGLTGPSLTIDTACSSSLLATHLAVQSLLLDECDLVLAGGVNVGIAPGRYVALSKARMFSPTGRCRPFDAHADGYVCGEGVGAVVLKKLDRALSDGDRVLAVIRGGATNQDGATNGLTAPNPRAQERLLEDAYRRAGISPATVGYLEAHGTGTALGDPIEMKAVSAVFRAAGARPSACALGSVKANVGHLEGAAGIASLIKVVLALAHGKIPPTPHFVAANPNVDFVDSPFYLASHLRDWARGTNPRRAGVSSFGFGGTNCHLVLEEAPVVAREAGSRPASAHLLTLSASSEQALDALVASHERHWQTWEDADVADVSFTSNVGRGEFAHRFAIVGTTAVQIRHKLGFREGAAGRVSPSKRTRVALLLSGQGSQYPGMAAELYALDEGFRADFDRCEAILGRHLDIALRDIAFRSTGHLTQTAYAQPALFAVDYCLAQFWLRLFEPAALIGHSLGEYVAACIAGVFSLEDALRIVVARGRAMQDAPGQGAMAAVIGPVDRTKELVSKVDALEVAAINGPNNVVLTGEATAILRALDLAKDEGLRGTRLDVSHAFHSRMMEPAVARFEPVLRDVMWHSPRMTVISNRTASSLGDELGTPDHWLHHLREPVLFGPSVEALLCDGIGAFLEVGPGRSLANLAHSVVKESALDVKPVVTASLSRGTPEWESLLTAVGALWRAGAPVDRAALHRGSPHRRARLPAYAFQRKSHWLNWEIIDDAPANARRDALKQLRAGRRSVAETLSFLLQRE